MLRLAHMLGVQLHLSPLKGAGTKEDTCLHLESSSRYWGLVWHEAACSIPASLLSPGAWEYRALSC